MMKRNYKREKIQNAYHALPQVPNSQTILTDAGLEKKFATGLCVPSRTFRSAPLSTQLLVLK